MKYFKITTNRASIKRLLDDFQSCIEKGEHLISPRPLPRELQTSYYALVCVNTNGKNIDLVRRFKNSFELTKQEYESEKASIQYYWSAEFTD